MLCGMDPGVWCTVVAGTRCCVGWTRCVVHSGGWYQVLCGMDQVCGAQWWLVPGAVWDGSGVWCTVVAGTRCCVGWIRCVVHSGGWYQVLCGMDQVCGAQWWLVPGAVWDGPGVWCTVVAGTRCCVGWTRCVVHSGGWYQVLCGMDQVCGAQWWLVPGAVWDGPGVWCTVVAGTRCCVGWTRCVVHSGGWYQVLCGMDQVCGAQWWLVPGAIWDGPGVWCTVVAGTRCCVGWTRCVVHSGGWYQVLCGMDQVCGAQWWLVPGAVWDGPGVWCTVVAGTRCCVGWTRCVVHSGGWYQVLCGMDQVCGAQWWLVPGAVWDGPGVWCTVVAGTRCCVGWTRCVVHSGGWYQVLCGMDQVCGAQCWLVPGAVWDGPGVWCAVVAGTRCCVGWTRCVVHSGGWYQVLCGMDQVCGAQWWLVPGAVWDGPGVWCTVVAGTRCCVGWTRCVVHSGGWYQVLCGMDQGRWIQWLN